MNNKQVLETLKTEVKNKEEYLKNVEDVARMSDNSVFDELRSKYTRAK